MSKALFWSNILRVSLLSVSQSLQLHRPLLHVGVLSDRQQAVIGQPADPIDRAHAVRTSDQQRVLTAESNDRNSCGNRKGIKISLFLCKTTCYLLPPLSVPHHNVCVERTGDHIPTGNILKFLENSQQMRKTYLETRRCNLYVPYGKTTLSQPQL